MVKLYFRFGVGGYLNCAQSSPQPPGTRRSITMDRSDPVEDPNAGPQPTGQPTESGPVRPADPAPLRARGDSRRRRPSIRLSRFPSIPSLDNANQPGSQPKSQPPPSFEPRPIGSAPPNEEDEAWLAATRSQIRDDGHLPLLIPSGRWRLPCE